MNFLIDSASWFIFSLWQWLHIDNSHTGRIIFLQISILGFVPMCLCVSGFNLQKYHTDNSDTLTPHPKWKSLTGKKSIHSFHEDLKLYLLII